MATLDWQAMVSMTVSVPCYSDTVPHNYMQQLECLEDNPTIAANVATCTTPSDFLLPSLPKSNDLNFAAKAVSRTQVVVRTLPSAYETVKPRPYTIESGGEPVAQVIVLKNACPRIKTEEQTRQGKETEEKVYESEGPYSGGVYVGSTA